MLPVYKEIAGVMRTSEQSALTGHLALLYGVIRDVKQCSAIIPFREIHRSARIIPDIDNFGKMRKPPNCEPLKFTDKEAFHEKGAMFTHKQRKGIPFPLYPRNMRLGILPESRLNIYQ